MYIQKTIRKIIHCSGVGLHSGGSVNMKLAPAPVNTGIVFTRNTNKGPVSVKVDGTKVVGTLLCTTIGENGTKVQTVEHLLAALSGLQITNLIIELDSAELPIMDGSAKPFVDLILKAGIQEQGVQQPVLKVTRPVEVRDGGKWIRVRPSWKFRVNCTIRFDHPLLAHQSCSFEPISEDFVEWIAPARTFGFLEEVEALRNHGLARGGSLENAVVVGPAGVLNKEGLRYADEFVRHKILDILGDLSLLGTPILGEVDAYCSGHQLNTKLVSEILSSTDSWTLVTDRSSEVGIQPPAEFPIAAQV
ncbi:MAG TPA: UDP-3-O-acyl-N-acetylglucosamine deacetylase [Nitrospiria bacterium]|nr:UDP-3-O-acyl-N-acetylglucosamine deacetylase [Nitrospiria bacterium]